MKRKLTVSIAITILLLTSGCASNSIVEDAVGQGKLALASGDYASALSSFDLAVDEGLKDSNIESLIETIKSYMDAKKLFDSGDAEGSMEVLEKIDVESISSEVLRKDVAELKQEVESYSGVGLYISEIEALIAEGSYDQAKSKIEELVENEEVNSSSYDEEISSLLDRINSEIAKRQQAEEEERARLEKEQAERARVKAENEAAEVKAKVESYRQRQFYGLDEDPEFTWDDAHDIIVRVRGVQAGTFYNGRRQTYMDDKGRRYYEIWKQRDDGSSNAEGTMQMYNVYEDGTVEDW